MMRWSSDCDEQDLYAGPAKYQAVFWGGAALTVVSAYSGAYVYALSGIIASSFGWAAWQAYLEGYRQACSDARAELQRAQLRVVR